MLDSSRYHAYHKAESAGGLVHSDNKEKRLRTDCVKLYKNACGDCASTTPMRVASVVVEAGGPGPDAFDARGRS